MQTRSSLRQLLVAKKLHSCRRVKAMTWKNRHQSQRLLRMKSQDRSWKFIMRERLIYSSVSTRSKKSVDLKLRIVNLLLFGSYQLDTFFVENLSEEKLQNSGDALECLKISTLNRKIAQTAMNSKSSRSHFVIQINLARTSPSKVIGILFS